MRTGRFLIGLAGLLLAIILLTQQGASSIVQASLTIGWGLVAIIGFEIVPVALKSVAWRALISKHHTVAPQVIVLARWIRQSVSQLLPVAQVGGDAVGGRVLFLRGVPGDIAGATTIVDLTFGVIAQIIVTIAGLAALIAIHDKTGFVWPILAGTGVIAIAVAGFVVAQRKGLFGFLATRAAAMSSVLSRMGGGAGRLDVAVAGVYAQPRALATNLLWQILAQVLSCGEIFIACYFLGYPITLADAFIMQSLVRGMRAAAFFVPGGLGVQEGGMMLLAELVGLTPATGLAIALIRRVRELAVGVPGLVAWQMLEVGRQARIS